MRRRNTRKLKLSIVAMGLLATVASLLLMVTLRIDGNAPSHSSTRLRVARAAGNYSDADLGEHGDEEANGYLTKGPRSSLEFHTYGPDVDLRIIVFAYDRPGSLNVCLTALEAADYGRDTVSVDVWLDRSEENSTVNDETLRTAETFNFTRGSYRVHVHGHHTGVQGQWMNAWRPRPRTKEIALFLEDDITVSPFFWRWLKMAHAAYARLADVGGFSISHPEMEHKNGGLLEVPANDTIFMYRVICTWGFSPQSSNWRAFQDWFFRVERDPEFLPVVEGILPTDWFLSERKAGKERTLWEQWHIYYTHMRRQYTVMMNPGRRGLLAVNRHERGLHDGHIVAGATQPICSEWSPTMERFPSELPRYGYDGQREGS